MNAKEVTRSILERALNDPTFLLTMAADIAEIIIDRAYKPEAK